MSMRYLIIYDISSDDVRRSVYKTLRSYGAWKQYSAFEVDLTRTQKTELKHRLENIARGNAKIRIYRICGNCVDHIEQIGEPLEDEPSSVV